MKLNKVIGLKPKQVYNEYKTVQDGVLLKTKTKEI